MQQDFFGGELDLFQPKELTLRPFVVLDVETTGRGLDGNYVIEVAGKRDDNEEYTSLICPPIFISPHITAITGITLDMVSMAPEAPQAMPAFLEFIAGRVIVAHNAPFDHKFIKQEAERLGLSFEADFIDTASISRQLLAGIPVIAGKSRHTLENLCAYFGIENKTAHRAMSDVAVTKILFEEHLWPLCVEAGLNPYNFVVSTAKGRALSNQAAKVGKAG